MRLEEALRLSAVEHKLDGDASKPRAKRPYFIDGRLSTRDSRDCKYIIAYDNLKFAVVWADTMHADGSASNISNWELGNKIQGREDWEPL